MDDFQCMKKGDDTITWSRVQNAPITYTLYRKLLINLYHQVKRIYDQDILWLTILLQ